jgi:hypothetical protein
MQPLGLVTLSDLVREDKLLWVFCCDCGHERDVNPAMVPLPEETPVPAISRRMKCSVCVAKDQPQAAALSGRRGRDEERADEVKASKILEGGISTLELGGSYRKPSMPHGQRLLRTSGRWTAT